MEHNIPRQVGSTVAHSPRLFAARSEAVSLGSDAWVLSARQRTQRVSSRRQTTITVVGLRVNPFRTAVPFWGQTTSQISSSLSPKRDFGSKGVKSNLYVHNKKMFFSHRKTAVSIWQVHI